MLFQAGGNPALSQEEQIKARAHRDRAARKLKVAQVLASSDFADEARQPLLEAIHAIGCALAIESHMPEPVELKDALQPPLSRRWTDALPTLSAFAEDASADWRPVAQRLATI